MYYLLLYEKKHVVIVAREVVK